MSFFAAWGDRGGKPLLKEFRQHRGNHAGDIEG
jgi:hypothetical protein